MSSQGSGIAYGSGSNTDAGSLKRIQNYLNNMASSLGMTPPDLESFYVKKKKDKSPQADNLRHSCYGLTTLQSADAQENKYQMVTLDNADVMACHDTSLYGLALLGETDSQENKYQMVTLDNADVMACHDTSLYGLALLGETDAQENKYQMVTLDNADVMACHDTSLYGLALLGETDGQNGSSSSSAGNNSSNEVYDNMLQDLQNEEVEIMEADKEIEKGKEPVVQENVKLVPPSAPKRKRRGDGPLVETEVSERMWRGSF